MCARGGKMYERKGWMEQDARNYPMLKMMTPIHATTWPGRIELSLAIGSNLSPVSIDSISAKNKYLVWPVTPPPSVQLTCWDLGPDRVLGSQQYLKKKVQE